MSGTGLYLSKKELIMNTIEIEDTYLVNFCEKVLLSIDRGIGSKVWDESGKEYLDFTSGWAVTSLGYSHPAITAAIIQQSQKIIHNPNSSLTYSPSRAKLLLELIKILPDEMNKIFFTNSGAEANDAAMKLARKITGKKKILSALKSFHGRTLATVSATGQSIQRDRFNVLVPNIEFFDYNDSDNFLECIDNDTAAVILELIQGEGGVNVAKKEFVENVVSICKKNGILLIVDEIQTGFYRTGPAFLIEEFGIEPDFLTMAKGIAGGFPFGAVAVRNEIAEKIEKGDHGGTYNGNPLGCAVAAAVINYMVESDIGSKVRQIEMIIYTMLKECMIEYSEVIKDVRGKGLLWALEFSNERYASEVLLFAQENGLLLNIKHGTIIRIFPALTITAEEIIHGINIISKAVSDIRRMIDLNRDVNDL